MLLPKKLENWMGMALDGNGSIYVLLRTNVEDPKPVFAYGPKIAKSIPGTTAK